MALIAGRLARRKSHFMPPGLLQSQFDALEEPLQAERPLVVGIVPPPQDVVAAIIAQLGAAEAARSD